MPPEEEEDDEWDGNDDEEEGEAEAEPSVKDSESEGFWAYSPNPLPLDTLAKVNAILEENHLELGDSRDWGGGGRCESYEFMFRAMTSCHSLLHFQHEDGGKDSNPEGTFDWIKQLFRCFPKVIRETGPEPEDKPDNSEKRGSSLSLEKLGMTWSIVIPGEIDPHVFADVSFITTKPPAKPKGKAKAAEPKAAEPKATGKKEASTSTQSAPSAKASASLKRAASPDAKATLPPAKQRREGL